LRGLAPLVHDCLYFWLLPVIGAGVALAFLAVEVLLAEPFSALTGVAFLACVVAAVGVAVVFAVAVVGAVLRPNEKYSLGP
jgi:hypothetical protein